MTSGRRADDLRVVVLSGLYPKPGNRLAGQFIHRQVVGLRELGVDARVLRPVARQAFSFRRGSEFSSRVDGVMTSHVDDVPVLYVPYLHVPHRLSTRLEALSIVRRLDDEFDELFDGPPHLVHGHWLFPSGHAAVELACRRDLPVVVSARGSDVHRYPRENRGTARLTRRTLRRANHVVAVSRALGRQVRALAGGGVSVDVVYNGVDVERFHQAADRARARSRVGLPATGTVLCSVGRLIEEKGVRELFQAFRAVAATDEDLILVMLGEGPLRGEVRDLAGTAGLSNRVILPGEVPHERVADWLRGSDVLVHASHAEGLPNVVLEAMACGIPVVATDVGGTPEVVDESVGRLVPPRDPGRLAAALEALLGDPDARRKIAGEAARRVRERFTWERSARDILEVYRSVLDHEEQEPRRGSPTPASTGTGEP